MTALFYREENKVKMIEKAEKKKRQRVGDTDASIAFLLQTRIVNMEIAEL